jgi:hypothetical protein
LLLNGASSAASSKAAARKGSGKTGLKDPNKASATASASAAIPRRPRSSKFVSGLPGRMTPPKTRGRANVVEASPHFFEEGQGFLLPQNNAPTGGGKDLAKMKADIAFRAEDMPSATPSSEEDESPKVDVNAIPGVAEESDSEHGKEPSPTTTSVVIDQLLQRRLKEGRGVEGYVSPSTAVGPTAGASSPLRTGTKVNIKLVDRSKLSPMQSPPLSPAIIRSVQPSRNPSPVRSAGRGRPKSRSPKLTSAEKERRLEELNHQRALDEHAAKARMIELEEKIKHMKAKPMTSVR